MLRGRRLNETELNSGVSDICSSAAMGALVVLRLPVVLWLLPGVLMQQTPTIGKQCPCQQDMAEYLPRDHLVDNTATVGMKRSISCCKNILLDSPDPGASIQWSFNGEAYSEEWSSSFKVRYCGEETITTIFATNTDRGNYSCTLTTTNGTSKTFSMKMTVERNRDHRDKPTAAKSSPNIKAMTGDSVTFNCEGYVGRAKPPYARVVWFKHYPNRSTMGFAATLPNVNVTQISEPTGSWGMIKGQLVISPVEKIHFGIYECRIINSYGMIPLNMSLTEGIPEEEATLLQYKTTMVVVVVASLLGLLVVLLVV